MKKNIQERGFTIMELLVSVVIIAFIAIILFNIYKGYNSVVATQQARVNVSGSARVVVNEFKKVAFQADHVVTSHSFSGVTYVSGATSTVFELPSFDTNGDIIPNTFDYIAFYSSSTNAYTIVDKGSDSARPDANMYLSSTLSSMSITYSSSDLTQATSSDIDVQTQSTVQGQTYQAHVHETARLRNL